MTEFWKNSSRSDGLQYLCKKCHRERMETVRKKWNRFKKIPKRKRCAGCLKVKPNKEFGRSAGTPSGLKSRCRICTATYYSERRRKLLYGLSPEAYQKLWAQSGGVCPICKEGLTAASVAIDHCHATGKVRGLLCRRCNRGLGIFRDDPEALRRAAAYLLAVDVVS